MNLKQKLRDALEDVEIDVTDLSSYRVSRATPAGRQFAGPSESEWDEDEEWVDKIEQLKIDIENNGVFACVNCSDVTEEMLDEDEDTNKYTSEALKILEEME